MACGAITSERVANGLLASRSTAVAGPAINSNAVNVRNFWHNGMKNSLKTPMTQINPIFSVPFAFEQLADCASLNQHPRELFIRRECNRLMALH